MSIAQLGTIVQLPDGREGTVVFNSLVGIGIKWGRHNPRHEDFEGTTGNTLAASAPMPEGWPWEPDALLRDPADGEIMDMPCVCDPCDIKVIRYGLGETP